MRRCRRAHLRRGVPDQNTVDRGVWPDAGADRFDDRGVTIHVFGSATFDEYLRFDCLEDDPHYHYNWPSGSRNDNRVVVFDPHANGDDMVAWSLRCLRSRLGAMLANSGGAHLAGAFDKSRVHSAIDEVEAVVTEATELRLHDRPSNGG